MNTTDVANDINRAVDLLLKKYDLSTRLINELIEEQKLVAAKNYFEKNIKLTPNLKLSLLLKACAPKVFRDSKKLQEKIIGKWSDEDIEAAYLNRCKDKKQTQTIAAKRSKLVKHRWTTSWAIEFMQRSGLPLEFAGNGRKNIKLLNYEDISPYIKLPDLVNYQQKLKEDLLKVINEKGDDAKCIITLPTGAGKTRIAVDAYLDYLRPRFSEGKYLIWIAQNEELCEQAIKSFQDVWQSKEFTEYLRIFRFYGNHNLDMEDLDVGGVVVCGIKKLFNACKDNNEAFKHIIENCGTCIIDEAHRAVTMMYETFYNYATSIRGNKIFPICGLTATPGRNDNEPHKLPMQFKYNIYKPDIPDNYKGKDITYFIDNGFLAIPKYKTEKTFANLDLSRVASDTDIDVDDLLEMLENYMSDTGCKELAKNDYRTRTIIDTILNKYELKDKSTIVYACTVEHANNINAILRMYNVKSVVISSDTPRHERLINIQKFKEGKLNFLINHSVLTTGFDAPKTDNIVICRPIFSDVLYEQIVGRGMRGPKFGGTEYCTVINFADNFERFGDLQSYLRFQEHWNKEKGYLISSIS